MFNRSRQQHAGPWWRHLSSWQSGFQWPRLRLTFMLALSLLRTQQSCTEPASQLWKSFCSQSSTVGQHPAIQLALMLRWTGNFGVGLVRHAAVAGCKACLQTWRSQLLLAACLLSLVATVCWQRMPVWSTGSSEVSHCYAAYIELSDTISNSSAQYSCPRCPCSCLQASASAYTRPVPSSCGAWRQMPPHTSGSSWSRRALWSCMPSGT